jgi:hypothetical protein
MRGPSEALVQVTEHLSGPTEPTACGRDLRGISMIASDDGTPDFHGLRSRRRGQEAVLYAFDLIEHDGDDLRDLPLIERRRLLARLCSAGPSGAPSGSASI